MACLFMVLRSAFCRTFVNCNTNNEIRKGHAKYTRVVGHCALRLNKCADLEGQAKQESTSQITAKPVIAYCILEEGLTELEWQRPTTVGMHHGLII